MRPIYKSLSIVGVAILALSGSNPARAEIVFDAADRAFFVEADTTTKHMEDDQIFKRTFAHFDPLDFVLTDRFFEKGNAHAKPQSPQRKKARDCQPLRLCAFARHRRF